MDSCIYRGFVRHRRFEPVDREFRYPIAYLFVNLDEIDEVINRLPLLGTRHWAICGLRRSDHLGDCTLPLDDAVRKAVEAQTGRWLSGPVRMLTLWSSLGFYFSPITLYFLNDTDDNAVAVLAEVSNTPWGERHEYVLWEGNRVAANTAGGRGLAYRHRKEFHVSPFLDIGLEYRWQLTTPADRLTIHLAVSRHDDAKRQPDVVGARQNELFDATVSLTRRPLTRVAWLSQVIRYPLVPARVLSAIYFQAFHLWIQKVPFYAHPRKRRESRLPESPGPTNFHPTSPGPAGATKPPVVKSIPDSRK